MNNSQKSGTKRKYFSFELEHSKYNNTKRIGKIVFNNPENVKTNGVFDHKKVMYHIKNSNFNIVPYESNLVIKKKKIDHEKIFNDIHNNLYSVVQNEINEKKKLEECANILLNLQKK